MPAEKKAPGFLLFASDRLILEGLSEADRWAILAAAFNYLEDGSLPNFEAKSHIARVWEKIRGNVDWSIERHEARSKAGTRANAIRWAKEREDIRTDANGCKRNPSES